MIARIALAASCLLSLAVGLTLSLGLELDAARGVQVLVPITVYNTEGDLITFEPSGKSLTPLADGAEEDLWLDLDAGGRVVGATPITGDAGDDPRPWVRLRRFPREPGRFMAGSTRLATEHHDAVAYAILRVSPSGTTYLLGLADPAGAPLGRGLRPW